MEPKKYKLDKSICKGAMLGNKEVVGLLLNGTYLFETTGPSHLNIYTIQIPKGRSAQAVVFDNDDGNKNESNYQLYVNWGDGASVDTSSGKATHNYYSYNEPYTTYTIRTTGELATDIYSSVDFPGSYIKDIVSIRTDYNHTDSLFRGYSGIKTVREPVLERLNNGMLWGTSYMFADCTSLEKLNLSVLDVSKVAYMSEMFYNCSSLTELDLSTWVILPEASVGGMFQGCALLQTLRLDDCSVDTINKIITSSGFPTGRVNGEKRKIWCKKAVAAEIATLPDGWGFEIVDKEEEPDVPIIPEEPEIPAYKPQEFRNKADLITVETMVTSAYSSLAYMFENCTFLESVNTQDWDTSGVVNMVRMFYRCHSLKSLNLSNFRPTITGTGGQEMFAYCTKLETLDMRNFKIDYYDSEEYYVVDNMFQGCTSLREIHLENCNTYTIQEIIRELPYNEDIQGIIYCRQANLRDNYNEIYIYNAPAGWKFEYVD